MPEIGEVEIVRRGLEPLVGSTLAGAELHDRRLGEPAAFAPLKGRRVSALLRHGKLLGIAFDELVLAVHLRMTGKLLWGRAAGARLLLEFEPAGPLSFVDPRRFGTADVLPLDEWTGRLGPDLLAPGSDEPLLAAASSGSRRQLKALLLDQSRIAGIGNYIADEALWQAGQHPERPAGALSLEDWQLLLAAARQVALTAIETGGASFRDYRRSDGTLGSMQERLACYGREGEPCLRCGATLVKRTVAGRGSTFCPACQRR